jgi:ABC-type nitrate/sulfonate/bicarbonate transport system permease component
MSKIKLESAKALQHGRGLIPPLLTLVILVGGWELAVRLFDVSKAVLPAPSVILEQTVRYFVSDIFPGWLVTVRTIGTGYLTGVPVGILLASIMSQSRLLTKALTPYVILLVHSADDGCRTDLYGMGRL